MSRMPTGQGQGQGNGPSPPYHPHHPHPQHQSHHQQQQQQSPIPQQQQQPMYYSPAPPSRSGGPMNYPPPPGEGLYGNSGPPPPPPPRTHNYAPYQAGPPPTMSGSGAGGWNDGYGPPPGSSSGPSGVGGPSQQQQAYPHHTPPDMYYPPGSSSGPPPGPGWSSVPPAPSSKGGSSSGRPGTRGNQQQHLDPNVKSEDASSSERTRGRQTNAGQGPPMTTAPLRNGRDASRPPPTAGGPANAAAAAAAADSGGAPAGPSEFIKKLYKMLEEESAMYGRGIPPGHPRPEGAKRGSVGWGRGGSTFVVWDMNDFTTKILPQTFRHSNFSSFVRQLNKYGFSKIKHTDENTGQIKENVWEFQHPNFQAGQKADLDSIKRKVVVPKKGEDGDGSTGGGKGMNQEDSTRMAEMESRVSGLEDQLALALEEIRQARIRETGLHNLARDMIYHMTHLEKGTVSSPMSDPMPSPQVSRLHHILDGIAGPTFVPFPGPGPASNRSNPNSASGSSGSRTATAGPTMGFTSHVSPNSSAGRGNEGTTPEGLNSASRRAQTSGDQDDIVEIPNAQQTLYNGDPIGMTPTFADMPSWFTEDTTGTIPAYNRKSSGGATLRLMLDTLASQGNHGINIQTANSFEVDEQDPLDNSPRPGSKQGPTSASANTTSPFGSLEIPKETENTETKKKKIPYKAPVHRRSTTITTSWMHAPKILVVEDDVVYRQLSSKFLEKFGCVIETVEDAQQAIEKMNHTKYDLVLMDIFFGPSMDGRKATSLIRQFDIYTPIISMTSNAQPQDVDSYLQSGMNDILAKPFTKYGLFGILDKHLIHLKAIQMSAEIPRSLGLPPLSDQGIVDAVVNGGSDWTGDTSNPLASMGWSDETYQAILQQFLSTGSMPEVSQLSFGTGSIGTNVIFGDNRKRAIELIDDDWTSPGTDNGNGQGNGQGNGGGGVAAGMPPPAIPTAQGRGAKRMKGGVGAK